MKSSLWSAALLAILVIRASAIARGDEPKPAELKPSSVAKVYLGDNGERITMLEVENSTKMLVKMEGIGGEFEGQTKLWTIDGKGSDRQDVYYEVKHVNGRKYDRFIPLTFRNGEWEFHPHLSNRDIPLSYSIKESKSVVAADIIKGYK